MDPEVPPTLRQSNYGDVGGVVEVSSELLTEWVSGNMTNYRNGDISILNCTTVSSFLLVTRLNLHLSIIEKV